MTPDIETRLRTYAEEQGLVPEQVHNTLLSRALEEAKFQDTLAGLDQVQKTIPCPFMLFALRVPLRVLYRHGRSTWQILFTIHEAEGGDQAYIKLHQLRNAAQKPLPKWPNEG